MSSSDTSQTVDEPSTARTSPKNNASDEGIIPQLKSFSITPELRAELALRNEAPPRSTRQTQSESSIAVDESERHICDENYPTKAKCHVQYKNPRAKHCAEGNSTSDGGPNLDGFIFPRQCPTLGEEKPAPQLPSELFCSFCRTVHPTSQFSEIEQQKAHGERMCINITGTLRLCPHMTMSMVDIWQYFESCCDDVDSDGEMESDPTITEACHFCVPFLSEFAKAKESTRKPTYTFYLCEKEWFDDIGKFDIEWTLPVAAMHHGEESGITEATMGEKLQEFDRTREHIICSHFERDDILTALMSASGDVDGLAYSAGECGGCPSEYFAEKHDDIVFLRRERWGILKREDEEKPVLDGCNGLVEQLELCDCRACKRPTDY
ncbi:hypothetical protein CKAH01_18137 [Colletotrichum kahawae]|uniref:Uncharacterized protein n=1 Tax=Colletotrichum kahawae TaxID=34407 RepID=A0AAE0D3B9_COLKA|nr:hypothetical protein CKAH01_18137 [Colletotrichum kahawae]